MKFNKFLLAICILTGMNCFAQEKNFGYKRKVNNIETEGWYCITLPPDIFVRCENDQRDLRLFSITGNDTTEVPYLLKKRSTVVKEKEIELNAINKSKKGDILFLTFELSPGEQVNYIDLRFEQTNYFAFVKIEGSDDKKEWFQVIENQRIFSIDNPTATYVFGVINFAVANYKYLRVSVRSDNPLIFDRALFRYQQVTEGSFIDIPSSWTSKTQKDIRQTTVDIVLDHYRPVSHLAIEIDSQNDFYRRCQISVLNDSTQTQKGWIRNYQVLNKGYLTSFKPNEFNFENIQSRALRLTIDNLDNPPLKINAIKAKGPAVELIAKLKPGNNYLFYGNSSLVFPSYDLTYFEEKIPGELIPAALNQEEAIDHPQTQRSALFESKFWLWAVMLIVIAVLGYFTLKMMKGKPDTAV